jgi:ATP-dependent helicase HrpB
MQDFFGLAAGPRLGGAPLLLHLWAPNKRAEQVTADLARFWREHYPAMHKRLSRRYPKHHWPADPSRAKAVRLARYA